MNHNSTIYYICESEQAFNLSETQFQVEKILPILYWAARRIQLELQVAKLIVVAGQMLVPFPIKMRMPIK